MKVFQRLKKNLKRKNKIHDGKKAVEEVKDFKPVEEVIKVFVPERSDRTQTTQPCDTGSVSSLSNISRSDSAISFSSFTSISRKQHNASRWESSQEVCRSPSNNCSGINGDSTNDVPSLPRRKLSTGNGSSCGCLNVDGIDSFQSPQKPRRKLSANSCSSVRSCDSSLQQPQRKPSADTLSSDYNSSCNSIVSWYENQSEKKPSRVTNCSPDAIDLYGYDDDVDERLSRPLPVVPCRKLSNEVSSAEYERRRSWLAEKRRSCDEAANAAFNYGYGDATPDPSYGYEDAAPTTATAASDYYGYDEDVIPHATSSFEEAALQSSQCRGRRSSMISSTNTGSSYGYDKDAAPSPSYVCVEDPAPLPSQRRGRRSSMIGSTNTGASVTCDDYGANPQSPPYGMEAASSRTSSRRASIQFGGASSSVEGAQHQSSTATGRLTSRRASVQFGAGTMPASPLHNGCQDRTKMPRRSSMKQMGNARRASIGYTGVMEVTLPGKTKVRRRTSIAFNEEVDTKEVTPINMLTDRPENLWFQSGEYKRIRQKRYQIVERVESGTTLNLCTRGLEPLLQAQQGLQRTKTARNSVLKEQKFQRNKGFHDDEHVASMYSYTTQRCQLEACERAKHDYEAVAQYLKETRRACRRMSM